VLDRFSAKSRSSHGNVSSRVCRSRAAAAFQESSHVRRFRHSPGRSPEAILLQEALDAPFGLTGQPVESYRENGYIKLRQVLSPSMLEHYGGIIRARVAQLTSGALPLEQRTTYGNAFLHVMNLWVESDEVRQFVFGRRLARIAAALMGVSGVRLYHDRALYEEAGGGITPWHAEQYCWPVDSDGTIPAWVPLQGTPRDMGPLAFCKKVIASRWGATWRSAKRAS
jgi:hypothetical protein